MRFLPSLVLAASLVAPCALAGAKPARPRQYKRVHQRILKLIEKGKGQDAVAQCRKMLQQMPDDPDTLYCLAVAEAQLGRVDEAVAAAARAVEAGLPLGRFLVEPRELHEPIVKSAPFQARLAKEPGGALVHGPMLGCLTATSARFWVRTARPAEVEVTCIGKGGEARASGKARTRADADFTAVVPVDGLLADTEYAYNVAVDGEAVSKEGLPAFRTFPPAAGEGKFRVAFGGGAGYVAWNERVWDTIRQHEPRALLMLGDNVYIDDPTSRLIQRFTYYRRQSRPEWRRLVACTPVYAIWDDHDFGTNDCVPGPHVDRPAWKVPVWEVFRQNWNNPAYGGGTAERPGCWFAFSIADVDFFMTDGRFYRTNPRGERPTMLGPAQKAWLLESLGRSKATFKVLVSGTPWSEGTKGGSRDTWDGFPAERQEIFSFLQDNAIGGVILLAADRHRSDVWKTERPGAYPLYEFESSRLTNQHRHGSVNRKNCLFSYNKTQSFGVLDFDTTAADPTVTYRVVTIDGEEVHAFPVRRSQLGPR